MLKGVIPVAVKVLKDQSYTSREEFQREVGLLKSLHNSNIVQFQVWRLPTTRCHALLAVHPSRRPSSTSVAWAMKSGVARHQLSRSRCGFPSQMDT